ncbi:Hypothetical predicted protein [Paramuricea clavata]|uniref:Uncharacterized protein n=1 Tax=Paramuricea clavata TaxID=317549 RepID=A0A7D9K365_PARCT|nr:Hypothetical predicted protein [Paramuricea clavata]
MIVCGVADQSPRERLLRDADLTLAKAIDAGIAAEETKRHAKELEKHQQSSDIHQVYHSKERKLKKSNRAPDDVIKKCKFCNGSHQRGNCPAYGKRCRTCNHTGAKCNVIPKRLLSNLSPRPKLKTANVQLSAYNGTTIPVAESLTFLGHTLSADGVKPDLSKVEAIVNMPIPESKGDLQRFLGIVNYLGKFVPNLSQTTTPLREMLKKMFILTSSNHNRTPSKS